MLYLSIHVSSHRLGGNDGLGSHSCQRQHFSWARVPSDETKRRANVRLNLAYLKTPRERNYSERARCRCSWLRRVNQRHPWLIALQNYLKKTTKKIFRPTLARKTCSV